MCFQLLISSAYSQKHLPERLHSLDVLRGLAALAIVFWHWQHFFYDGTQLGEFHPTQQPFYSIFKIFYIHGALAVNFFFSLSGFIFFWLYAKKIISKEISAWNFSVLRFSRLYPLHLITLILVLILQLIAHHFISGYIVYPLNDSYHTFLNLTLTSAWGFEHGWSLNAPIWSVSIEVLLYILFFITLRWVPMPLVISIIFVTIGTNVVINYNITIGLCSFFSGGIAYLVTKNLLKKMGAITSFLILTALVLSTWLYISKSTPNHLLINTLAFPSTIALLATLQTIKPDWLENFSFVGELSYSTYLLHFPLQMIFIFFTITLGMDQSVYYSPITMAVYFTILIIIGLLSYRLFEAPAQKYLRRTLIRHRNKATPLTIYN